jgi:hypothetical protein
MNQDAVQVTVDDAEAVGLLDAARARQPHARPGWEPAAGSPFVVLREGGGPIAGAALERDRPSPGRWYASAVCVEPDASPAAGSALVDALEAIAHDGGGTHLRFDATAFLVDEGLELTARGYVTGPPYDGNADVEVWAERLLGD